MLNSCIASHIVRVDYVCVCTVLLFALYLIAQVEVLPCPTQSKSLCSDNTIRPFFFGIGRRLPTCWSRRHPGTRREGKPSRKGHSTRGQGLPGTRNPPLSKKSQPRRTPAERPTSRRQRLTSLRGRVAPPRLGILGSELRVGVVVAMVASAVAALGNGLGWKKVRRERARDFTHIR